jgi:hypothetical protein
VSTLSGIRIESAAIPPIHRPIEPEIQMHKVKLSLETLQVESFETVASGAGLRGTVAAHMPKPGGPQPTYYVGNTCECTLELSCVQTDCGDECFLYTADTCYTCEACPSVQTCPTIETCPGYATCPD